MDFASQATANMIAFGTLTVTLGALFFAWLEIHNGMKIQREIRAQDGYQEYLKTALEYPKLATPGNLSFQAETSGNSQYEWFVARMLMACESILINRPTNDWMVTIKTQLAHHRTYLGTAHFVENKLALYSKKMQQLIQEVSRTENQGDSLESRSLDVAKLAAE